MRSGGRIRHGPPEGSQVGTINSGKERLLRGIVRREWFRAEADEVVNVLTLVLVVTSLALLGSLVV